MRNLIVARGLTIALAALPTLAACSTLVAATPWEASHSSAQSSYATESTETDPLLRNRQFLPVGGNPAWIAEDPTAIPSANSAVAWDDSTDSDEDFEDRLKKLEDEWAEYQEELEQIAEKAKTKPTVEIGGRIHLDYWAFPDTTPGIGFFEHPIPALPDFGTDPEDRFAFRRIRLEMDGDALETMYWRLQVDFADPAFPSLKDVYIGFRELPGDQRLQIGNQKRPLGLDHLNSSRFNVFLERPLVIEAFNQDARRLGILMQGNSRDEVFLWQYGVYNLEDIAQTGAYIGDAYQLSGNARLVASPWYDECSGGRNYVHGAISGMLAHPDGDADALDANVNEARFRTRPEARSTSRWFNTERIPGADWYEILGFEALWNRGPLQIVSEYQHAWMQQDATGPPQPDLQFHGWYVYVNYVLTGEFIPYDRKSGTIGRLKPFHNFGLIDRCCGGSGRGCGAWGVGVRYSAIDLSDGDIQGGDGAAWTLALNWYWTPYARLQFNLIHGELDDHAPVGGFTSGRYTIIGTRAAVDF